MNTTFGTYLRTTVWGQSHAAAIGCTVEGLPAGEAVDEEALCAFMGRRAPGGRLSTQRRETDQPEILCGLMNGITCGAPLTALIRNTDQRSKDYKAIADRPRPSHADLPAQVRYQGFQDVRGGGAFSGRLTAPICCAGGIALQILARRGIRVAAHLAAVGTVEDRPFSAMGETDAARDCPWAWAAPSLRVLTVRSPSDFLAFQGSKVWSLVTALRPHAVRARLRTTPGSLSSLLPAQHQRPITRAALRAG